MRVASGIVVGVPIDSKDAVNSANIEQAIQQAIGEANERKIEGKDIFGVYYIIAYLIF